MDDGEGSEMRSDVKGGSNKSKGMQWVAEERCLNASDFSVPKTSNHTVCVCAVYKGEKVY